LNIIQPQSPNYAQNIYIRENATKVESNSFFVSFHILNIGVRKLS
jgi:hypothetical protein